MPKRVPAGMPVNADIRGAEREALTAWMRERLDLIESEAQARIELLRTVGEHPSPIFSQMVKRFGALGLKKSLVARLMNIGPSTLELHYRADYEIGEAEMIASIATNMLRIGTSLTHPDAAKVGMDVLNRRGGDEWRPPAQKLEVKKTDDAAPIIDSTKLTYEERQQLRTMLRRVAEGGEGEPLAPEEEDHPLIE